MPSSYTTNLRLTLPVQGELSGTWGDTVNTGITALLDSSVAGAASVVMTDADYTLTSVDGATDQARQMFLTVTGTLTAARNVICPTNSKLYFIKNSTTGGFAITLKTSAGTGISIPSGKAMALQVNGTDVVDAVTYFTALDVGSINTTTLDLTNLEVTNIKAKDGTTAITLANTTGVATIAASPIVSSLTASQAVFSNGSKNLVSNAITGTGNVVMSASPTLTGTISAAAANFSGAVGLGDAAADNITVNGTVTSNLIFTDNTYDIGASGATRPRNLFLAGNATVGGNIVLTGALDVTNLEVTNIKAKDGTDSISLADTTGIATFSKATVVSTTDNTNAALRITQLGTGNALVVEDSTNPDATPFVIDASGNAIVGTTTTQNLLNPANNLQSSNVFQVNGTSYSSSSASVLRSSDAPIGSYLVLAQSRGSLSAKTISANADPVGTISFQGYDGTNFLQPASITAAVDGTPGTNDMPGRLVFSTTPDGSAVPTERMRIGSDGGVGIGAGNAVGYKLIVTGIISGAASAQGIASQPVIQSDVTSYRGFRSNTQTTAASFVLANSYNYWAGQGTIGAGSSVTTQVGFFADGSLTGATNNYGFYSAIPAGTGDWGFYAAGTADNYFAGNVGIGTTTPQYKLDNTGVSRLGSAVATAAPSTTDILPTAHTILGGAGSNYLTFGQYPTTAVQWIQSSFLNPTVAAYGLALNPLGGNVGIGTSLPATKLEVSSATGSASPTPTEIRISTTTNASDYSTTLPWGRLSYYSADPSSGGAKIQASIDVIAVIANGGSSSLAFSIAADTTGTLTERMRLDNFGNVGIGTSSPSTALQVNGTVTATTFAGAGTSLTGTATSLSIGGTAANVTGTVAVANGGTGATSLALNNVILGNNGGAVQLVAPGTTGNVLTSNGTTWTSAVAGAALAGVTDSASPFETALGTGAGAVNTGVNNTFIGFEAGNDNTTGTDNVAVGYQALDVNITGANNTAIGTNALGANTASGNTAVGRSAMLNNTSGTNNVAMGVSALVANTTGATNVGVGSSALTMNTTGSDNTAVGQGAMVFNTVGTSNTAVGQGALRENTASNNAAFGYRTLYANTTGTSNVAVGYQALDANTTASNNTAVGHAALGANTGASNTAVGSQAGLGITTGPYNTVVGYYAGAAITTGAGNTFVGSFQSGGTAGAGSAVTTGSKNVIIGGYTGGAAPISATGNNYIVLSDGDGNVRQAITSAGGVSFDATGTAYGTSGQVLTSAGNAPPTWTTPTSGSFTGARGQVFTTTGTFTVPAGITTVKVTVVGGGGNGGTATGTYAGAGGGGGGGVAIKYVTGLTPGGTVAATVGGVAGTSSFGAHCSATGGATAANATTSGGITAGGAGGAGSSGDINATGGTGATGKAGTACFTGEGGCGGGSSSASGFGTGTTSFPGTGQFGNRGGFGGQGAVLGGAATGNGCGGGGGGAEATTDRAGGAGLGGIIVVEW